MPTPFATGVWEVEVVATGSVDYADTVGSVGRTPPVSGMPVFIMNHPVSPARRIEAIDVDTGLITVAESGATGDALHFLSYPWDVQVLQADAETYGGWPTGIGSYRWTTTPTTGVTSPPFNARTVSALPGTGFLYG